MSTMGAVGVLTTVPPLLLLEVLGEVPSSEVSPPLPPPQAVKVIITRMIPIHCNGF